MKVAEQVLVANAITTGMFNASLKEFITGKTPNAAYGNIYQPSTKDKVLTLPEMLGIDRKSQQATSNRTGGTYTLPSAVVDPSLQFQNIKDNLMANGFNMMTQVIAIPLVFKFGKKFLAKPIINPANRLIRAAGVKEVKV